MMAFCSKCGNEIDENAKFCSACGAQQGVESAEQTTDATQKVNDVVNDLTDKVAALNNTADTTDDYDKADIEQNKAMGVLSYLSLLVLIPIFAAPKSKFARFHANQGLILLLGEVAWGVASNVVIAILTKIAWELLAWSFFSVLKVFTVILRLVNLVFLVLSIIGIVNAANGRAKELPVIGKIRILK